MRYFHKQQKYVNPDDSRESLNFIYRLGIETECASGRESMSTRVTKRIGGSEGGRR